MCTYVCWVCNECRKACSKVNLKTWKCILCDKHSNQIPSLQKEFFWVKADFIMAQTQALSYETTQRFLRSIRKNLKQCKQDHDDIGYEYNSNIIKAVKVMRESDEY